MRIVFNFSFRKHSQKWKFIFSEIFYVLTGLKHSVYLCSISNWKSTLPHVEKVCSVSWKKLLLLKTLNYNVCWHHYLQFLSVKGQQRKNEPSLAYKAWGTSLCLWCVLQPTPSIQGAESSPILQVFKFSWKWIWARKLSCIFSNLITTWDSQFWLYKTPRTLYREKKEKKNKGDKQ